MIRRFHSPDLLLSSPASFSSLCSTLARRLWVTFELHQLLTPLYALLLPKGHELPLSYTSFTIHHAPSSSTVVCSSIVFNLLFVSSFSRRRGVSPTFNGRLFSFCCDLVGDGGSRIMSIQFLLCLISCLASKWVTLVFNIVLMFRFLVQFV